MDFTELFNNYHIMPQFPPAAVREAEQMPTAVSERDLQGREDLTSKLIITIDGDNAKDFDDAVSLEVTENGNRMLGVHIADVTHYVTEGSPIDAAAFMRGTSVYLIDTVIPMLPFALSNGLCSLRPHEVRLTLSVFMEFTPRGRLVGYRISKSFIRSRERMTYNNVTRLLEGDSELRERYAELVPMLEEMRKLAATLKKKRKRRGEIEFASDEAEITLDAEGKPTDIKKMPVTVSNGIIEEFMLICNETVAKHMSSAKLPCVYRVHDKPDPSAVERLAEILPSLGAELEPSADIKPKDFSRVLEEAKNTEYFETVSYLALRTMAKAKYSEKNGGHFGLATDNYCHFTSPIRRYPDLAVHRILKESMDGEIGAARKSELYEFTIGAAVSASVSETNAAEAEFAFKDSKKAEYMSERIGEIFDGTVTYVTRSGFFVGLENTVEGFVAARNIEDDVYILSENGFEMTGINSGRRFSVGDRLRVRVTAADSETGKIDFELCGGTLPCMKRGNGRGGRRKLTEAERKLIYDIKGENREAALQKAGMRDKADFERNIFESAVCSVLSAKLCEGKRLSRDDKIFIGITLSDAAARLAEPLYRSLTRENVNYTSEAGAASAEIYVRAVITELCLSFDIAEAPQTEFAVKYVRAALIHLNRCVRESEMSRMRREYEYADIADWVRDGRGFDDKDMPDFRKRSETAMNEKRRKNGGKAASGARKSKSRKKGKGMRGDKKRGKRRRGNG